MSAAVSEVRCYLVEWYESELTDRALERKVARLQDCVEASCGEGSTVHFVLALAVPDDEMVFGVFTADSEQSVALVCRRAGITAQRVSEAIDVRAGVERGETPDSVEAVRS